MVKEGDASAALEKLQRLYNAFKFIEQRLAQKKTKLKIKLPEITKTYRSLVQMEEQSVRALLVLELEPLLLAAPFPAPLEHSRHALTMSALRPQKLGEALVSHYELAQSIFAKAKINVHENDKVSRREREREGGRERERERERALPALPPRSTPRLLPLTHGYVPLLPASGVPVAGRECHARVPAR